LHSHFTFRWTCCAANIRSNALITKLKATKNNPTKTQAILEAAKKSSKIVDEQAKTTEIELLGTPMADDIKSHSQRVGDESNSITGAKLLQGVEKSYDAGVKILDASAKTTENRRLERRLTPLNTIK